MNFQIGFNEIEIDSLENKSVEAVWTYYNVQATTLHIVPDGRADIIFTFNVQPNGQLKNITPLIAPPFTKAQLLRVEAHQGFIGLRLRAGSSSTFLESSLTNFSGVPQYGKNAIIHIPWLENFCHDKKNINHLISEINQQVCTTSSSVMSSMVFDILSLIDETQGLTQVNSIAQQIRVSERTINRVFSTTVGLSPKKFSSIVRLRRAINGLTTPSNTLSSIAIDCGFSDQAHMTREIKSYMRHTPLLLQQKLNTEILT